MQENTNKELPFASDEECSIRRVSLILGKVIKTSKNIIYKKDKDPVVSTVEFSTKLRKDLIKKGLIDPNPCKLYPPNKSFRPSDEGEYRARPIKTEADYFRKRQTYFRMMQDIFHSRRQLKLALGKKKDNDPDWFF